jgi:hypothetical protein
MYEMRNAYKNLLYKPERKRQQRRLRRIWDYNIKIDFRKIGFGSVRWIYLALNRDRWRGVVISDSIKKGNFVTSLSCRYDNECATFMNVDFRTMEKAIARDSWVF